MIKIGDKLPSVVFKIMTPSGPEDLKSDDFFAHKKVALFAVPGAYTPTCTAKHLPGYVDHYQQLKAKGIDEIACVAVNDIFVMHAWAQSCKAEKITMLSDGNGTFTHAIELKMNGESYGLGSRSQRYAMIVDNGIVTQLFVEQPGEFKVSSVEHILSQL